MPVIQDKILEKVLLPYIQMDGKLIMVLFLMDITIIEYISFRENEFIKEVRIMLMV
jgi:hypothetical protein